MEKNQRTERITLSIALSTNQVLEAIQHHLRRAGHRKFKSEIIHEAVVLFAKGLGLAQNEESASQPSGDAGNAAVGAASLE
jgi:hypothetical protein